MCARKSSIGFIVVCVLLTALCWPAAAYELNVKAWIDGRSQLVIENNAVYWHNLDYNAPGYEGQTKPLPTYLTTAQMGTVAWKPTGWSNGTSGDTTSARFTKLNLPLAAAGQTVILNKIQARVSVTIAQQPAAANGYTLIVDFNDNSQGGADWYEVSLEYLPGAVLAHQDLGILEGMTGSQAYAINSKGQATGESWDTGFANSRAFFWDPKTGLQDMGTPVEWTYSSPCAINTKGQVVGILTKPGLSRVFFWDPKSGMHDLGNLGGDYAWCIGHSYINDKGQLCGTSATPPGNGPSHAIFWDPKIGDMVDLGILPGGTYSEAWGINSKGQVVGRADTGGQDHAFMWDPKIKDPQARMQDLDTLPGRTWSHAYAINSKGQVVGDSGTSSSDGHAFLWDPKTKAMVDLGTLPGGAWSYATWVNSKGQVIGKADSGGQDHAFFWDPKVGEMVDLGTLGGTGSEAWSINSKGQVAGYSTTSGGDNRAFLWDPKAQAILDLGTPMGGTEAGANDINAKGQVAGYSTDASGYQHAVIWQKP